MIELPPELKKAEVHVDEWHGSAACNGGRTCGFHPDDSMIPSSVVASFLEAARKELEKVAVERREVAVAEYTDLKEFRTWKKELWVNLSDALAVFGGEGK